MPAQTLQQPQQIRILFLKEFIRTIIESRVPIETKIVENNSPKSPQITSSPTFLPLTRRYKDRIVENIFSKAPLNKEKIQTEENKSPILEEGFIPSMKSQVEKKPEVQKPKVLKILFPQRPQQIRPVQKPVQEKAPPIMVGPKYQDVGSERLKYMLYLLIDNSVSSVECPGPDKPLIIYKGGAINPTNVSMSSDEINEVMKEISRKTRIPLSQGLFKAIFDNYVITAVISEFVGTRFLMERAPPPPQVPQASSPANALPQMRQVSQNQMYPSQFPQRPLMK